MSPISRTQAWCRLAILIADGLPAPTQIAIDKHGVVVCLDSASAFELWSDHLGAERPAAPRRDAKRWSYTAYTEWCGLHLVVSAVVPAPTEAEPVTEDMSAVRAIAGGVR